MNKNFLLVELYLCLFGADKKRVTLNDEYECNTAKWNTKVITYRTEGALKI